MKCPKCNTENPKKLNSAGVVAIQYLQKATYIQKGKGYSRRTIG